MRNIVYDKIIPLGDRCNCTQCLKYYNLRPIGRKLPFDWVKGSDLPSRIKIIEEDFTDFLVAERLKQIKYARPEQWDNNRFYDTKTKIVFAHDFPKNLSFADGFKFAVSTFEPKIKRFFDIFAAKEKVLFVYMSNKKIPNNAIKRYVSILRKKFGYDDIDMLIVENGTRTIWRYHKKKIADGITKIQTYINLMPPHFSDTTKRQFKILDKIFSEIKVKPEIVENNL